MDACEEVDVDIQAFNLCLRWRWVINCTPSLFYLKGKAPPPYPVNRRLGVPQSPLEHSEEEINLLPLLGIEPWFLRCCLLSSQYAIMALLYSVLHILYKSCHTLKKDYVAFLFCTIMCEFFMFCTQIRSFNFTSTLYYHFLLQFALDYLQNNNIRVNYTKPGHLFTQHIMGYWPYLWDKLDTMNTEVWLTSGIKTSCLNKRKIFLISKNSNDPNLQNHYKKYCKILSEVIKLV